MSLGRDCLSGPTSLRGLWTSQCQGHGDRCRRPSIDARVPDGPAADRNRRMKAWAVSSTEKTTATGGRKPKMTPALIGKAQRMYRCTAVHHGRNHHPLRSHPHDDLPTHPHRQPLSDSRVK